MLRPPSSARFYWFAARVQEGKVFFLYAAEPTQVFTQQSSQSPATALLAFKCGGGMFLFILILRDSTLCKQCIRFICGFYRFCYDSNKTTNTWRITFTPHRFIWKSDKMSWLFLSSVTTTNTREKKHQKQATQCWLLFLQSTSDEKQVLGFSF